MDDDIKGIIGIGCIVAVVAIVITVLSVGGCILGTVGNYAGSALDVARQELDPHELLRKYSWFKDAAAVLDKKQADIKVYTRRIKTLEEAYAGQPRSKWARDDREQWSIWQSECAGIKASYNELAAEYNANMAKIQWSFCEVGKLPPGADKPLPREYKPYTED